MVSVNSTKEISSILEYSSQAGVPCYATLGYDASMDDVGVAWIKLLALPDEYRKFIIEHEVENVIIAGIGEDVKSESYCRKLSKTGVDGQEYADGSLYILYTQSGSEHDIKTISRNVVDYDTLSLEKVRTWPIGRAVLSTGRSIIYQKVFVNILRHKFIL